MEATLSTNSGGEIKVILKMFFFIINSLILRFLSLQLVLKLYPHSFGIWTK